MASRMEFHKGVKYDNSRIDCTRGRRRNSGRSVEKKLCKSICSLSYARKTTGGSAEKMSVLEKREVATTHHSAVCSRRAYRWKPIATLESSILRTWQGSSATKKKRKKIEKEREKREQCENGRQFQASERERESFSCGFSHDAIADHWHVCLGVALSVLLWFSGATVGQDADEEGSRSIRAADMQLCSDTAESSLSLFLSFSRKRQTTYRTLTIFHPLSSSSSCCCFPMHTFSDSDSHRTMDLDFLKCKPCAFLSSLCSASSTPSSAYFLQLDFYHLPLVFFTELYIGMYLYTRIKLSFRGKINISRVSFQATNRIKSGIYYFTERAAAAWPLCNFFQQRQLYTIARFLLLLGVN